MLFAWISAHVGGWFSRRGQGAAIKHFSADVFAFNSSHPLKDTPLPSLNTYNKMADEAAFPPSPSDFNKLNMSISAMNEWFCNDITGFLNPEIIMDLQNVPSTTQDSVFYPTSSPEQQFSVSDSAYSSDSSETSSPFDQYSTDHSIHSGMYQHLRWGGGECESEGEEVLSSLWCAQDHLPLRTLSLSHSNFLIPLWFLRSKRSLHPIPTKWISHPPLLQRPPSNLRRERWRMVCFCINK